LGPAEDDPNTPGFSLGGNSGNNASDEVGPPRPDSDTSDTPGAVNVGGDSQLPAAVDGDTSAITAPDALTILFPGCVDPAVGTSWKSEVLRLVNQERAARGVDAVVWNDTLAEQASQYACELIAYDFFDHVNPVTGSTLGERARDFGYEYWIVGENLAAGQRSPVEAMADWMSSPCHRENVLNPAFVELGVGLRYGGDYGYYWVQEFGRPLTNPYDGDEHHDPECRR
jgi:uncharacterized protein YkwD